MTAEMKDPYRTLPIAIFIGMPLITVIYVLANIAYFTVLTPLEVTLSEVSIWSRKGLCEWSLLQIEVSNIYS